MAKYLKLGPSPGVAPWELDEGTDLDELRGRIADAMSETNPRAMPGPSERSRTIQIEVVIDRESSVPMTINLSRIEAAVVYESDEGVGFAAF